MTATIWKIIVFEKAKVGLIKERREAFKLKDEEGFKQCISKMADRENDIFQSVFYRIKKMLNFYDKNMKITMNFHLGTADNREALGNIE
jgi:hypothetical protein